MTYTQLYFVISINELMLKHKNKVNMVNIIPVKPHHVSTVNLSMLTLAFTSTSSSLFVLGLRELYKEENCKEINLH